MCRIHKQVCFRIIYPMPHDSMCSLKPILCSDAVKSMENNNY